MAIPRIGGETPLVPGIHTMSVEAPDGTDSGNPVEAGDILALDLSVSYKAEAATAADTAASRVLLQALHRMTSVDVMGCVILGIKGNVRRLKYPNGSAPTLGQSVEVHTVVTQVVGKAWAAGEGTVVYVDTANEEVEVLF